MGKMLQDTLQPSFMQMMLDEWPDRESDHYQPPAEVYRCYKKSVMQDLEDLLNNRCHYLQADQVQTEESLLTYGVTDFAHINISSLSGREMLRLKILDAIRINEPRLSDVQVQLNERQDDPNRLGFTIEGTLNLYSEGEEVIITALFEPSLKTFNFKSELR